MFHFSTNIGKHDILFCSSYGAMIPQDVTDNVYRKQFYNNCANFHLFHTNFEFK